MAEPFREQVQALRDEMFENLESPDHMVSLDLVVERLDDLLSQPTPTAEPPRIEDMAPRTTENPEGWPYSVAPDGAERCGVAFLGYEKGDGSCEYLPGHPGRHWSTQWGSWSL